MVGNKYNNTNFLCFIAPGKCPFQSFRSERPCRLQMTRGGVRSILHLPHTLTPPQAWFLRQIQKFGTHHSHQRLLPPALPEPDRGRSASNLIDPFFSRVCRNSQHRLCQWGAPDKIQCVMICTHPPTQSHTIYPTPLSKPWIQSEAYLSVNVGKGDDISFCEIHSSPTVLCPLYLFLLLGNHTQPLHHVLVITIRGEPS